MPWNTPGYNSMFADFGMHCHEMIKQDMTRTKKTKTTEYLEKKLHEIDESFNLILHSLKSFNQQSLKSNITVHVYFLKCPKRKYIR